MGLSERVKTLKSCILCRNCRNLQPILQQLQPTFAKFAKKWDRYPVYQTQATLLLAQLCDKYADILCKKTSAEITNLHPVCKIGHWLKICKRVSCKRTHPSALALFTLRKRSEIYSAICGFAIWGIKFANWSPILETLLQNCTGTAKEHPTQ